MYISITTPTNSKCSSSGYGGGSYVISRIGTRAFIKRPKSTTNCMKTLCTGLCVGLAPSYVYTLE